MKYAFYGAIIIGILIAITIFMEYVGYAGIILAILGILIMIGSAGGKVDKRFKTGRKDNKETNTSGMKTGLYTLCVGVALWYAHYSLTSA